MPNDRAFAGTRRRRTFPRDKLDKSVEWLRPAARFLDRWLRPRLTFRVNESGVRIIALICISTRPAPQCRAGGRRQASRPTGRNAARAAYAREVVRSNVPVTASVACDRRAISRTGSEHGGAFCNSLAQLPAASQFAVRRGRLAFSGISDEET
ncbi:MAG: exopolysaccharide biosynthesis protein [Bacteroidota bacterium]